LGIAAVRDCVYSRAVQQKRAIPVRCSRRTS